MGRHRKRRGPGDQADPERARITLADIGPATTAIPSSTRRTAAPVYPAVEFGDAVWLVANGKRKVPDPLRGLADPDSDRTTAWLAEQQRRRDDWMESHADAIDAFQARLDGMTMTMERRPDVKGVWSVGPGEPERPGAQPPLVAISPEGARRILIDVAAKELETGYNFSGYVNQWIHAYTVAAFGSERDGCEILCIDPYRAEVISTAKLPGRLWQVAARDDAPGLIALADSTLYDIDVETGEATAVSTLPVHLSDCVLEYSGDCQTIAVTGTGNWGGDPSDLTYVFHRDGGRGRSWWRRQTEWTLINSDGLPAEALFEEGRSVPWVIRQDREGGTTLTIDGAEDDPPRHFSGRVATAVTSAGRTRAVMVMQDGTDHIEIFDAGSSVPATVVHPPQPGSIERFALDRTGTRLTVECSSLGTAPQRLTYDLEHDSPPRVESLREEYSLPEIHVEKRWATAADGISVPYLYACRRDLQGSPMPTVVRAYGGFGETLPAGFDATAASWIEAGGAWVMAMPRGGGERGEAGHRAGVGMRKMNTVADTVAVLEDLVATGAAAPGQIATTGESHGGWLAAYAAVLRPDLVKACAPHAPESDLFMSVTGNEFGDPATREGAEQRELLSPYHYMLRFRPQIGDVFLTSGERDMVVNPLQARKLAAAVQHLSPESLCLLDHDPSAGHFRSQGTRATQRSAMMLTFVAESLGLELSPKPLHSPRHAAGSAAAPKPRAGEWTIV